MKSFATGWHSGVYHKFVLLQLKIDFNAGTTNFEEIFVAVPNSLYHVAIDSAISFMIKKRLHIEYCNSGVKKKNSL